jgi:hypothetical protein
LLPVLNASSECTGRLLLASAALPRQDAMSCRLCSSENEAEFTAEIMIHFRDRRHLENPGVLTFPEIAVCLDCGSTRFVIPEAELRLLRDSDAASTSAEHKAA